VPIRFGFQPGSWHPCADAILRLFYGVVPQLVKYDGSLAGGKLSRRPMGCVQSSLLVMSLVLCRTAAAVARTTQKLSVILTNLKLGGTTW